MCVRASVCEQIRSYILQFDGHTHDRPFKVLQPRKVYPLLPIPQRCTRSKERANLRGEEKEERERREDEKRKGLNNKGRMIEQE